MFSFYLKKLIPCPATWVGAVILFLSMLFVFTDYQHPDPELIYFFQSAMPLGITHWFMPVATVLPICYVRYALEQGAAWQFPLLRTSPLRYSVGGLLAAFVSGAWIVVLASALFVLFLYLAYACPGSLSLQTVLSAGPFYARLPRIVFFLLLVAVLAGCGGMYAAISYAVSGFCRNQYICAASPMLLYFAATYSTQYLVYYRKFVAGTVSPLSKDWISYLDPAMLPVGLGSSMENGPEGGLVYYVVYLSTVLLVCGGLFHLRLRRRLKNG